MGQPDFRTRSAMRKRHRMRERLLQATMDVCGAMGPGQQAVIDDVIRAAGVSRGTFYKYFSSLDEARAAVGEFLTNDLVEGLGAMFEDVSEPVQRTASGWILIMARAAIHPAWGAFVMRTEHFSEDSVFMAAVRRNTLAGMNNGDYSIESITAAMDFQMGVAIQGMRHLVEAVEPPLPYITAMTRLGLRGLGVSKRRAESMAQLAMRDVTARAPDHLEWWRALE